MAIYSYTIMLNLVNSKDSFQITVKFNQQACQLDLQLDRYNDCSPVYKKHCTYEHRTDNDYLRSEHFLWALENVETHLTAQDIYDKFTLLNNMSGDNPDSIEVYTARSTDGI